MKKINLFILLFSFTILISNSKTLSLSEAIEYANRTSTAHFKETRMMSPMVMDKNKKVSYQLKYTKKSNETPTIYVVDKSNGGYMFLSANDNLPNGLIGYTDDGTFNADSIPEGLQYLLETFNETIYYANNSEIKDENEYSTSQIKPAIAPIIVACWSQGNPWNAYCPEYDGKKSVVGCVGVAIGQILHYYRHPYCGKGTISYKSAKINQTITYNFEENPIQWDKINSNMANPTGSEMWDAVEILLYQAAVACKTNFSPSGSSSTATAAQSAFVNIFDYSNKCQRINRSWYTDKEWEEIIYNELYNGRPVFYSGQSASAGGHAFICDGYSNGYFHINWGWWGGSNGYFLLPELDPNHQGVGYSKSETAIIGLEPKNGAEDVYVPLIVTTGDMVVLPETKYRLDNETVAIRSSTGMFNQSIYNVEGYFGIKMCNINDTDDITYIKAITPKTLLNGGVLISYYITPTDFPNEGQWLTTPSFYQLRDSTWYDVVVSKNKEWAYITEIKDDSIYFYEQSKAIENDIVNVANVTDIAVPFSSTYGQSMEINITVSNTTNYKTTKIYTPVLLKDDDIVTKGTPQQIEIEPNSSTNVTWQSYWEVEMENGNYQVALIDKNGRISDNKIDINITELGKMSTSAVNEIIYDISSVYYVEIYDMSGMLIVKGEKLNYNLKPGKYIVQYYHTDGTKEINKIWIK